MIPILAPTVGAPATKSSTSYCTAPKSRSPQRGIPNDSDCHGLILSSTNNLLTFARFRVRYFIRREGAEKPYQVKENGLMPSSVYRRADVWALVLCKHYDQTHEKFRNDVTYIYIYIYRVLRNTSHQNLITERNKDLLPGLDKKLIPR